MFSETLPIDDWEATLRRNIAWAESELAITDDMRDRLCLKYCLNIYRKQLAEMEPPIIRTTNGNSRIATLKEQLDICQVISRYTPLKGKGNQFYGKCPIHDDGTASLSLDKQKQLWHCFGCGKGGDLVDFVKLAENCDTRQALRILGGMT